MEHRRLTAHIAGTAELISGKYVKKGGFESNYVLTNLGRRLSRVRVMGTVVDKFVSEDGSYGSITVDDGTSTLRCKTFVNLKILDGINLGDLVDVVGKVREHNDEIYAMPEIIRIVQPNAETLRLLELKKIFAEQNYKIERFKELQKQSADLAELKVLAKSAKINSEDIEAIMEAQELIQMTMEKNVAKTHEEREKVLRLIETLDIGDGADYQNIVKESKLPEHIVDTAVQELLETGICFEPKAGRIKKL